MFNLRVKSLFFVVFILGFFAGIFLLDLYFQRLVLRFVFCLYIVFWILVYGIPFKLFLSFFIGLLIGCVRFYVSLVGLTDVDELLNGHKDTWVGCVVEEVDVRFDKVNYILEYEDTEVRVLFSGNRYPVYDYGDCLLIEGALSLPENGEEFSYQMYLFRYGVAYVVLNADVLEVYYSGAVVGEKLFGKAKFYLFSKIYSFKFAFESRLNYLFSEPYSSFLSGLILGSRKGISSDLLDDFQRTGLTHIIAISGYNITLLVLIVSNFLTFLSRRMKVIVSIIFIFLFVVLVGMSAAVVRAGIMGTISLFAVWFGRQYVVGISLLVSAFFMCLWNPWILLIDVGFHLSFLATCGLIYVSPLLEKYFKFLPKSFGIRESFLMTISAQVLALPIILLNFQSLSVISPIANVIVLPFIPIAMLFGFLAVVFSVLNILVGQLIGVFAYLSLSLIVFFVQIFSSFHFSYLEVKIFNWWFVVFYYFIAVFYLIKNSK